MSELFGNPEQVSELSGNPEQLPYTPTTEEVREGYSAEYEGCDCENCQYDRMRFDRWFESIRKQERERAINIIDKATLHYGKTHSASTVCRICEMLFAIEGEDA